MFSSTSRNRVLISVSRVGRFVAIALGMLIVPVGAMAATPSFGCGANFNQLERVICSDDRLAKLDVELAGLYRHTIANSKPADRRAQIAAQRTWLKFRDHACPPWVSDLSVNAPDETVECIGGLYVDRIDQLVAEDARLGMEDFRSKLRPGQSAFIGDVDMHCGGTSVELGLSEALPDSQGGNSAAEKIGRPVILPARGSLGASFADCRLSDGTSIRVKEGMENQPMAYGQCGADPARRMSVWVDQRKVISSLRYSDSCGQPTLASLSIGRTKASFCLAPDIGIDFDRLVFPKASDIKRMKLTHGNCGDIAFSGARTPDHLEFAPAGKHLNVPGTLTLEAATSMRAVCQRMISQDTNSVPEVPDDVSRPEWKELKVDLPQPEFDKLGYNATTLSRRKLLNTARFDLNNSGGSSQVYMVDDDSHWFDGSVLAAERKDVLVTPFDAHDWGSSLSKGIYAFTYEHASVFFQQGRTYILLNPVNWENYPSVIMLNGSSRQTVCTFRRTQENF